jgi:hypothetical protein
MVDGRIVKRDGALVDTDLTALSSTADSAADAILGRIRDAGMILPGTPPGAWSVLEPMARDFYEEAHR